MFEVNSQTDTTKSTILKLTNPKTPIQILKENAADSARNETGLQSGGEQYSAAQDSAFNAAMNSRISSSVMVNNNIQFSNDLWRIQKELDKGTPWQIAYDNVRNIPPDFFIPSPVEVVHRQIAIENSQYIPFINTMPRFGKFSIDAILSMLGLSEDVSPEITYSIDFVADVEVVVYSISSSVVATLFNGRQVPGRYTITWNGRDSKGKLMPPGDYIAEVRIGKEKYIRKRIVIR